MNQAALDSAPRDLPVEAVLFDLDDTLVDHRGAAERGLRLWLSSLELDGMLEDHVERWFILEARHYPRAQRGEISFEEQRRVRIREFLPSWQLADDAIADDTYAGFLAYYRASWSAFPDAAPAIARAHRAGLKLGILTNGPRASQQAKLDRTGLSRFGVPLFASSELPAAKPDRRAFEFVCAQLQVASARCLMVGDSFTADIAGGRAAGLQTALLERRTRRRDVPPGVRRIRSLADLRLP